MALQCEFIDVIVPIANIERVYPGGFAAFKAAHQEAFGLVYWHDTWIFREGAMFPAGIDEIIAVWRGRGLEPTRVVDGQHTWRDLCVVEHAFGGPTLPCAWLTYDRRGWVSMKDAPPEPVMGPSRR